MMLLDTVSQTNATPARRIPAYDAEKIMQDGDVAHIILGEQVYTLRITRAGKLILTK